MVTQILNFGLPSPIDVQIVGPNQAANREFAEHLLESGKVRSRYRGHADPAAV